MPFKSYVFISFVKVFSGLLRDEQTLFQYCGFCKKLCGSLRSYHTVYIIPHGGTERVISNHLTTLNFGKVGLLSGECFAVVAGEDVVCLFTLHCLLYFKSSCWAKESKVPFILICHTQCIYIFAAVELNLLWFVISTLILEIQCSLGIFTVFTLKERHRQIHLSALVNAGYCHANQSIRMCSLWRNICFLTVLPYYQIYRLKASVGSLSIAKSYIDLSNNFDVLYVNTAVVVFTRYVTIEQFYGGPYEISSML